MSPDELKLRVRFHEEQANRLLQANPLVAEFFHHMTQMELLKQRMVAQEANPVSQPRMAALDQVATHVNGSA